MERPGAPEARAAAAAAHEAGVAPFRFYGWCGAVLAVVGAAGFIWESWSRGSGE